MVEADQATRAADAGRKDAKTDRWRFEEGAMLARLGEGMFGIPVTAGARSLAREQ